ncbi:hypothetical protein D3C72_1490120 [compost metagenome]
MVVLVAGELHPHEEQAGGVVVVLGGFFDVAAVLQQKARDGVHQPQTVGAGQGKDVGGCHSAAIVAAWLQRQRNGDFDDQSGQNQTSGSLAGNAAVSGNWRGLGVCGRRAAGTRGDGSCLADHHPDVERLGFCIADQRAGLVAAAPCGPFREAALRGGARAVASGAVCAGRGGAACAGRQNPLGQRPDGRAAGHDPGEPANARLAGRDAAARPGRGPCPDRAAGGGRD